MKDIIKDVITDLKLNLRASGTIPILENKDYVPIEISKSNFHLIQDIDIKKKIAFIDGGNAELIKAPNFSIHLIRLFYVTYEGTKRLNSKRYQFYLLVTTKEEDGKLFYLTKTYNFEFENLKFSIFDKTLKEGNHRVNISKIGNCIRRLTELKLATLLTKVADIVVLDGTLDSDFTYEKEYIKTLYKHSKNTTVVALSKTTELITNKGDALTTVINKLAPSGCYYYPIARASNRDIYLVKLHPKTDYIFRFEIFKDNTIKEALSILKQHSKDAAFLGYPYGLIEADKFARITTKEQSYMKLRFLTLTGKDKRLLDQYLRCLDAHNVLNSIT